MILDSLWLWWPHIPGKMGVHIETWSGSDCGVMTSLLGMQWSAQYGHVFGVEMMDQVGSLLKRDDGRLGSCWRWRERGLTPFGGGERMGRCTLEGWMRLGRCTL